MKWFKIESKISRESNIQKLKINGKDLCLITEGNEVYACSAKCPHAGADISEGWLDERKEYLVCPVHRRMYNLKNGRGPAGQGDYLPVYKIEERSDGYYIELPENWIKKLFNF